MSEQAWSREPWFFDGAAICDRKHCPILAAPEGDDDGNALRAVSCVNALASVPKPEGVKALIDFAKQHLTAPSAMTKTMAEVALRACGLEPIHDR